MSTRPSPTWQSIQAEVIRRISERVWQPGELIPGEVELADEFGCARATVNRALRQLAEAGFLDRRRKAGTRVALHPVRKATLTIPITRQEVEQRGARHSYQLLSQKIAEATATVKRQMALTEATDLLHLRSLHLADSRPFVYEDRWINPRAIHTVLSVDFTTVNANEWLVQNAPFTAGKITLSAAAARPREAKVLQTSPGTAIFVINRTTWNGEHPITAVRLAYAPGFQMETTI